MTKIEADKLCAKLKERGRKGEPRNIVADDPSGWGVKVDGYLGLVIEESQARALVEGIGGHW